MDLFKREQVALKQIARLAASGPKLRAIWCSLNSVRERHEMNGQLKRATDCRISRLVFASQSAGRPALSGRIELSGCL